jgi:hypothetical protein
MKFELDKDQCDKLKKWQEAIKIVYGEYGDYKFTFSPNGIGCGIVVFSVLANTTINLTDINKW